MCTLLLPPGDNPIAVNKYINIKEIKFKLVLELVQQGVSVLFNAVYTHPVKWK
jgi:hypothetical protein